MFCIVLLVTVEYRVQVRIVVHLHLLIHLHVFASGSNVVQQLVDGSRQVGALGEEHAELLRALVVMLLGDVGAINFYLHVVDLQIEDRQAVDGPSWRFGIDGGVGQHLNVLEGVEEVAVDHLNEIGAILVRLVNPALEHKGSLGIDFRVADDVLEVPLHGVDPVLQIKEKLDCPLLKRVLDRGIYVIGLVIVGNGSVEDAIAKLSKFHKLCV